MPPSDPSPVVTAGSGSVGAPPPALSTWQFEIYDRANNQLADITTVATAKRVSSRLSRPGSASFQMPSNHALAATLHTDGHPILTVGRRCLKVRHRASPLSPWVLKFNGIIWSLEDSGDEDKADTAVAAFDPLMWFKWRYVRDSTGDLSTPTFVGTGPDTTKIAGADLIKQMVDNTNTLDGEIGLDTSAGLFEVNTATADDLTAALNDWPITMADFLTLLTNTGGCDVTITPVDDGDGFAAGKMGIINAESQAGTTTVVHFDYGLGDFSVKAIRRGLDIDNLCNKLWYYLGDTKNVVDEETQEILIRRWEGNITQDDPTLPDPPQTAIDADIAASRSDMGVAMDIHVYDSNRDENAVGRPMYHRLWQMENILRNEPREMLFVTPIDDGPFDVNAIALGDIITINASSVLRAGFAAQQRVYGFDVEISDENVSSITQIVTSADAE